MIVPKADCFRADQAMTIWLANVVSGQFVSLRDGARQPCSAMAARSLRRTARKVSADERAANRSIKSGTQPAGAVPAALPPSAVAVPSKEVESEHGLLRSILPGPRTSATLLQCDRIIILKNTRK